MYFFIKNVPLCRGAGPPLPACPHLHTTVGLLNVISFRFLSITLNLDSMYYPALRKAEVSKDLKLLMKFESVFLMLRFEKCWKNSKYLQKTHSFFNMNSGMKRILVKTASFQTKTHTDTEWSLWKEIDISSYQYFIARKTMTPLSLEADQNYPRQVRSPIIMKFVFELYRETDKLWPKTSLFWFERTLRQVLVFICKVSNIAADCFCRNCPRNGSRGCQAIPQSRWHQSGRGEKRLEHHHLCSEDEQNRQEGAGDSQTR